MSSLSVKDLQAMVEDPAALAWEFFREGVGILRLHGDPASGPAAALLRYDAGARVPPHEHTGWEYIYVLSGAQEDERGRYARGAFTINAPGSRHGVTSRDGCIVLAIWEKPVRFVSGAPFPAA